MKQEQQSGKGFLLATRENLTCSNLRPPKNYSTHLLLSPAMQASTNSHVQNDASPGQSNSAMQSTSLHSSANDTVKFCTCHELREG